MLFKLSWKQKKCNSPKELYEENEDTRQFMATIISDLWKGMYVANPQ